MDNNASFAGYTFRNPAFFEHALTHSSYANERKQPYADCNERLEFLGDAVVELSISGHLYHTYPKRTEGELTRHRAAAVCEPTLARMARKLGLGELLRMGRGEEQTGGRNRDSTLSDAFEAVVGAVYLDGGFDAARDFVVNLLKDEIAGVNLDAVDHKTYLQEYLQRTSASPISYSVIAEDGPAHERRFTVRLDYEGKTLSTGEGRSKKEAEQEAANAAIEALGARKE